MEKRKSIYAASYAAAVSITAVVAMTISAELSASFKEWLASFTGHHWITKSWASIIVFVLFLAVFRLTKKFVSERETARALFVLEVSAVLGFFAILGFYSYEFFAA